MHRMRRKFDSLMQVSDHAQSEESYKKAIGREEPLGKFLLFLESSI